ncbi:hypothetical protein P280DRAFT_516212 [Massarina eburnea CBS 473.64]|uniref:Dystroglycan-type cadherin-like domain-containing protein n=1 Tax=Massarina eburnea CBS 473.64 TaxID=1395130 RepID=A0A6A6S5T4_9PLEO|nr:hypothetical protein P280DRAFT_516212 [Massarina eburnea CBS 473.64]
MAIIWNLDILSKATVWTFIIFVAIVTASPQVSYALDLQFPPVAKVGEAYSFQFAPTTFQPDPDKLQYSLVGGPSWLRISSNNRTLWGTPGSNDVGPATFKVAAAGEAGAVANMDSKLLVAKDTPKVVGNVSQYLSKAGQLSGSTSVNLLPSKPFEIDFDKNLFEGKDSLSYYATSGDHTPLPSWVGFDTQALRFAGTAPASPVPQSYELLLIASDIPGFAAASVSFTLVVSNHQLLFKPFSQSLNISKGDHVQITALKSKLFLDNTPIRDEDVQSASAELPSWLSFDTNSFNITGTPPSGLMSQDIKVTVQDRYGESATHGLHITFISKLFTSEIGQLNITLGQYFDYTIPRYILVQDSETVSVDLGELGEWLRFDPAAMTIQGTIPEGVSPRVVEVALTATSSDSTLKDIQTFQVQISGPDPSTTLGSTPTDNNTDKPGASDASNVHKESGKKRAGQIVGTVVAALIGALLLVAMVFFLCRRKKQKKGYISPKATRSPRKSDISRPIPIIEERVAFDIAYDRDLEKGKDDDSLRRTPRHPPQLNLEFTGKCKDSHSLSSSVDEDGHDMFAEFNSSPMGLQDEAGPSHRPHDSMKIATDMARRSSTTYPLQGKDRTTESYRESYRRSAGLPINRRLKSIGHGRSRHTYSPSRSTNNFSTLRHSVGSSSFTTNTMSVASTVPSAYPQPAKARHTTQLTTPLEKRRSIRPVPASSTCDSLLDRRTIDEKRLSYIRKRKSVQSPFFGGAASRASSGSYQVPPTPTDDINPRPSTALTPKSPNIVKPTDDIVEERTSRDLPGSLRIRRPADTPSPASENENFPGSLRKGRSGFVRRHTEALAAKSPEKSQVPENRPGTTIYRSFAIPRRESARESLRAMELKLGLNSQLKTEVFDDAELSESVYSDEDDTIKEAEKRSTITPSAYAPPPLNPGKSKRSSKRASKEGNRNSKRETKRTSQRDPTPFSLSFEHGGKENESSSYSLNYNANAPTPTRSVTATSMVTIGTDRSSPLRPKTSTGVRPVHRRTASRTVNRISSHRNSQGRPLSRENSTKERHSRKSIHSRTQSRQSITAPRKPRNRSRTQSGAYPHFDASSLATLAQTDKDNPTNALSEQEPNTSAPNRQSREESTLGTRSSKYFSQTARQSRISHLQQLHTSPFYHSKRDTLIPSPVTPTPPRHSKPLPSTIGLGLSFTREDTPGPESASKRSNGERTPLSILDDGNGGSPERLRVMDGKGKRPVSVEVDEGVELGGSARGRWGSLRGVLGRSGGGTFWGKGETAFV